MQTSEQYSRRTLRLPKDATEFLDRVARENCTSANAEIIRAVRERMDRMKAAVGEKLPGTNPTAGRYEPALQGGLVTQALEMPR